MKNKRNFIAELRTLEMPYSKCFTKKGLRNALFSQYLQTELKPNLKLYFNSHISQKEWKDGLAETHLDIPENTTASRNEKVAANVVSLTEIESKAQDIQSAFFALVRNNKLPSEYYTHTITDTPIFHTLVAVKQQIERFQKGVFEEMGLNAKEYAESFTEKLIYNLKQMQIPELSNAVIKDFISEKENIQFDIRIILGENVPSNISLFYEQTKEIADNSLSRYLEQQPQQVQQDNKKTEEEIKSFEDLFYDPNLIHESLDVLRNAEPPLIDKKGNWIGRPLGAICVWTDELKTRGIMKRADGKMLSKYLSSKIKGFSISESMFRKHQQRAQKDYCLQFKSAISKIKTT